MQSRKTLSEKNKTGTVKIFHVLFFHYKMDTDMSYREMKVSNWYCIFIINTCTFNMKYLYIKGLFRSVESG